MALMSTDLSVFFGCRFNTANLLVATVSEIGWISMNIMQHSQQEHCLGASRVSQTFNNLLWCPFLFFNLPVENQRRPTVLEVFLRISLVHFDAL